MYNFIKENEGLFASLASILNDKGAGISMGVRFVGEEFVVTNIPVVNRYTGPEGEGFYFRASRKYFGISELELAQLFPINIDGYTFRMVSFSDYEVEFDEDRFYPESFSFVIEKDGKNIFA